MHKEIDIIVQDLQAKADEFDSNNISAIEKHADEINRTINYLQRTISDMQKILNSDDVKFVSTYQFGNEDFRRLHIQLQISFPNFITHAKNREHIFQQFGLLLNPTDHPRPAKSQVVMSSLKMKNLTDEPVVIANLNLVDEEHTELRSVSCLSDNELLTCGEDEIIRLYNLQGELLKSVQTILGRAPWDITVTQKGHLVYSDHGDGSVNIV